MKNNKSVLFQTNLIDALSDDSIFRKYEQETSHTLEDDQDISSEESDYTLDSPEYETSKLAISVPQLHIGQMKTRIIKDELDGE